MKRFTTLLLILLCAFSSVATQTRDAWRSVRTNHLFVIGNADAEKLREVAVWLEFFHSAFGRLVSRNVLESSVPTTVIIFRDDASFLPFKPLYQGRPLNIAGYFQPGDDTNYIAISLDPSDRNPYSTAFHEYIHLHINDNIPGTPLWLNEGLAELYGSLQFSGNDAYIGTPLYSYIELLREEELLPLKTLFSIGTDSPHYNEQEKTGIFYGESWALVHYLMFGDRGRQDQFKRFLQQVGRGEDTAKAIQDAFGVTLDKLEEELRLYVHRGNLTAQRITGVDNPTAYGSYTATQRSSLTDGEANFYLGDLLFHQGRDVEAERYLKRAIALDPGFVPPYASLGLLYIRQRRYTDAKNYLQKATTSPQSYLVHYYYAYVLSRERMSPDGTVSEFPPENAAIIREQLKHTMQLAPNYAPAHYLLAIVNLIRNERLDEALEAAQKAHQLAPANKNYSDLVEDIQQERSGTSAARQPRERIKGTAIAEPEKTGTARMLGGDLSGGTAIHDGQTIESSGSLPSVDEVLKKYVEAAGGAAAINAVKSRVVKGTVDVVGVSRGGPFEIYSVAPDKAMMVMPSGSIGDLKIGYNGRVGWSQIGKTVRMLQGVELATLKEDCDFYGVLRIKDYYSKVALAGKSKIGYREVYVIELSKGTGPVDRLYVDPQTYLPVRLNTTRVINGNSVPIEVYFDDWREVNGLKIPFTMSQTMSRLTMTFTIKEVLDNVPIDAKIFERPL
jgi:tetratricopeptide (TPR) repeat protein